MMKNDNFKVVLKFQVMHPEHDDNINKPKTLQAMIYHYTKVLARTSKPTPIV